MTVVAKVEGWSLQNMINRFLKFVFQNHFQKQLLNRPEQVIFCSLVTSHLNRSPSGESRSTCANAFKQMYVICIFLNYFILKLKHF